MKRILLTVAVAAVPAALCAQREPANFSNNPSTATTVEAIRPDGASILCRQSGNWGTIPWGATTPSFSSLGLPTLTVRNAIWRPNSQGVYYAEDATIGTTSVTNLRYQGAPANRSILLNINPPVRLFCVDAQDNFLYGTQSSGASTNIVRIPLNGPANLQVVQNIVGGNIDELEIDPSGTRLLALQVVAPFSPRIILSMPAIPSAVTPTVLSSGVNHQNVHWIAGQSACVFQYRDANVVGGQNNNIQIGRVNVNAPNVIVPISGGRHDHQHLSVSPDQAFLAFHIRNANTGTTPSFEEVACVMPASGGGEILLNALRRFDTNGQVQISNTAANGTRIAYPAREVNVDANFQCYGQSLDAAEIFVTPHARVGVTQTVSFANPGAPNNFVGVLLNLIRANGAIVPPVVDPILVDPVGALAVFGISNLPNPSGTVTVPNNTAFLNVELFYQAVTGLPSGTLQASRMVTSGISL